jgi:HAE1 family hydrophobic/amphiphilic exporter-1
MPIWNSLKTDFPPGLKYAAAYDTTLFVKESIIEVIKTLLEAMLLVFLVVYIFLQNWRATLVPAIAIPVSLVGTFAVLQAFGFSINTLTLFGLVLAIGIVVDDAIVVVENASRCIDEKGMSPKEATKEAMREVTGPIIATTLVLMSVLFRWRSCPASPDSSTGSLPSPSPFPWAYPPLTP